MRQTLFVAYSAIYCPGQYSDVPRDPPQWENPCPEPPELPRHPAPAAEPDKGWTAPQVMALSVVAALGVIVALTTSLRVPVLPSGIAMILLSRVSAKLSQRFGRQGTLALGAGIIGVGFLGRIVFTDSLTEVIVFTTVAGAGTGIAHAAMPSLILQAAPASEPAAAPTGR